MKNYPKILAWLMLLTHLTSWALLNVAPRETAEVVFKKVCARTETLLQLTAASKKQVPVKQQVANSETGKTHEQKPEVKLCSVKLAQPPIAISLTPFSFHNPLEQIPFRQVSYRYQSISEEPDPPRFA